jgi:hypothetical protein
VNPSRRLLNALWAALWLYSQLIGVRLRRLFGSHRTPEAGPDFHLAAAQVPVEDVDYDPDELPSDVIARLDTIRNQLLASVPSGASVHRPHRARPRRVVLVAATSLLLFGVAGAGATALVTGTTGFEAVDRVLGIYEAESQKPETLGIPVPGRNGARPDLSHGRASVSVLTADGSSFVATSYVAQSGEICSVVTGLASRSPDSEPGALNTLSCISPTELAERLDDGREYLISSAISREGVVLAGLSSGDVVSMRGRGPNGPFDVEVGERWSSGLPGLGMLTPFAGVSPPGDETSRKAGDLTILDPSQYSFERLD